MAGTITSQMVVRLIDQVTGPARTVGRSLVGLNKAANGASGSFGARLGAAIERNNRALDATRGRMIDAVGGFYALKAAIGAPLRSATDFESKLLDIAQKADLSNEAMGNLRTNILAASKALGSSASSMANSIDDLLGKGMTPDDAMAIIGPITKTAAAYRAASEEVASASFSVMDNLKVPADEVAKALDVMAQAGKSGAFELKDMAAEFPSLTARAQALGMTGVDAVSRLSAALQIARKGAGTSAEAANNVANLMQKIISPETTKKFKGFGIDIREELKKTQAAGGDVFEMIADQTMKATKGDLSKIGDIFQDSQVQGALLPLIQNLKEYQKIREDSAKASGVVDNDFDRRAKTAQAGLDRLTASTERLSIVIGKALQPVLNFADNLTALSNAVAELTERNPKLARVALAAAGSLVAFKVATTALSFVGLLGRGGALSMLSVGFNSVGRAAIGAARGARAAVAMQTALGAMSGMKLTGLQTIGTALRGMALAIPGVSAISGALTAVGGALAAVSAPVWLAIGAGVAVVAAAGALLWKYYDRVSSVMSGVGRAIGEVLAPAVDAARPILHALAPIGDAIAAGWARAKEALSGFGEWMGSFFQREVLSEDQKAQWENAGHDAAIRMIDAIKSAFSGLVTWAADIGSRIGSAIADGASAAVASVKAKVSGWIGLGGGDSASATPPPAANSNAPSAATSGHRATGGNVWSGGSFLVGENQAEIFTPRSAGTITPLSKAGGMNVNIGDIIVQGANSPRELAIQIKRELDTELAGLLRGSHADSGAYG